MPLFALVAFAKNERADIHQAARNDFRRVTDILISRYKKKKP